MIRRVTTILAALSISSLATQPAWPQASDYPTRTVTIVAPAAPGGLYSLFARLIGVRLEQRFGKSFIIENRPGASSIVGSLSVIRSPHDGYTLMIANTSGLAANVTLHKSLPYDPTKDFAPVALIARVPEVLVVNAALPVHSLAELSALAGSTPGGLSYASAGAGTAQHLSGVEFGAALGVPVTHVPYKGMQPAIADVAGGHIAFMFSPISFALPLAQAGKLRMLGVTTAARVEAIPDVPPLTEVGLRQFDAVSWFMLVAPAGTPADIVSLLHREVSAMIAGAELRREFVKLGLAPVASPPPAELASFVKSEIAVWGDIIRQAGLAGSQ